MPSLLTQKVNVQQSNRRRVRFMIGAKERNDAAASLPQDPNLEHVSGTAAYFRNSQIGGKER